MDSDETPVIVNIGDEVEPTSSPDGDTIVTVVPPAPETDQGPLLDHERRLTELEQRITALEEAALEQALSVETALDVSRETSEHVADLANTLEDVAEGEQSPPTLDEIPHREHPFFRKFGE